MLNDNIDYGKRLFRSYQHDSVVCSKQWKASNLNDRVDNGKLDHVKMIFRRSFNILKYYKDEVASKNLSEDKI